MFLLSLFFILTLKRYNIDDTAWVGQFGYNDYDDAIKLAIIWYYENAAINLITMNNDRICFFCFMFSFEFLLQLFKTNTYFNSYTHT